MNIFKTYLKLVFCFRTMIKINPKKEEDKGAAGA